MNLLMFMRYILIISWLVCDGMIASVGGAILQADVVAGLTVGLMVVPQSLAYAKSIAGLPIRVRKMQLGLFVCACECGDD
jgi:MFS superfamily sulfate permease-like transporter